MALGCVQAMQYSCAKAPQHPSRLAQRQKPAVVSGLPLGAMAMSTFLLTSLIGHPPKMRHFLDANPASEGASLRLAAADLGPLTPIVKLSLSRPVARRRRLALRASMGVAPRRRCLATSAGPALSGCLRAMLVRMRALPQYSGKARTSGGTTFNLPLLDDGRL